MKIFKDNFGFTLVELLIVMAVLGILSTIAVGILDPGEQMARARDSGRRQAVLQLVITMQSYTGNNGGLYPTINPTLTPPVWITPLVGVNEAKAVPPLITYKSGVVACSTNQESGYCYKTDGTNAIIFVKLESKLEKQKANCLLLDVPYFLWSSAEDRTKVVCSSTDPTL